jgi:DNA-3-methyladenine glycosylase II
MALGKDEPISTTRFEIAVLPPFRLDLTVWALRRRPGNIVDRWDGTTYRRAMRVGGALGDIAVAQVSGIDSPRLDVTVTTRATTSRESLRAETTIALQRMLGLEVDLGRFHRLARRDADLDELSRRFRGLKPPRFLTLFESLANAIACQQLTLTIGIELLNRLAMSHGRLAPGTSGAHAFPEAGDLAGVEPDALRALGFSRQKSSALIEIADRVAHATLCADDLTALDNDAALARLQALRGIGRWSAEYVLLRGLGRLDTFPGDDVGARNNLRRRLGIAGPLDYSCVRAITARWSPYGGLVYFHFLLASVADSGWIEDGT